MQFLVAITQQLEHFRVTLFVWVKQQRELALGFLDIIERS